MRAVLNNVERNLVSRQLQQLDHLEKTRIVAPEEDELVGEALIIKNHAPFSIGIGLDISPESVKVVMVSAGGHLAERVIQVNALAMRTLFIFPSPVRPDEFLVEDLVQNFEIGQNDAVRFASEGFRVQG